ncbi:MAG: histidinol dehydrogenase, partial [Clostridia bacterium]|nr:histidinol dehydrogenase [Clostridia bacterium]
MIRILTWGEVSPEEIFSRNDPVKNVSGAVSEIIRTVRDEGDKALYAYAEKFDGVRLDSLVVTEEERAEARKSVSPAFRAILEEAAGNIRRFHQAQVRQSFIINDKPGVVMGQKIVPLDRVGLYVPGGTAAYPSTVLMDAIPARIAG